MADCRPDAKAGDRRTENESVGRLSNRGRSGLHSALYPVHVYATFSFQGQHVTAHAVAIFATDFKAATAPKVADAQPLLVLPPFGAVSLATVKTASRLLAILRPAHGAAPGGLARERPTVVGQFPSRSGRSRPDAAGDPDAPALPTEAGNGVCRVSLATSAAAPIRLTFFNAIRDSAPNEPKSDGVTFRVWANQDQLFERHTDAKVWTPGEADLSRFAGREILLRLESHPGPKHNTVCDSSFWGDPVVVAGNPPKLLTADEHRAIAARAVAAAASGKAGGQNLFVFELPPDGRAALALGPNGLADGVLAFACQGHVLALDGLRMAILDQPLGDWPSGVVGQGCHAERDAQGRLTIVERCTCGGESFDLTTAVWSEGPGLRVKVCCPQRITDVAPGEARSKGFPRVLRSRILHPRADSPSAPTAAAIIWPPATWGLISPAGCRC